MTESAPSFSKYRPVAKLGQGGMAQVFLAMASGPVGFNKLVVIKQILEELADEPDFVAMFLDEARLAARLNHPNVVQTTEVGIEDSKYYLCMEYLEGQPVNRVFGRVPRTELTRAMMIRILVDTLNGLHYAHEVCDLDGTPLEVVHRDISPHNVFLTYEGQVKVVDFGIAKAASSSTKTQTGVTKGKVNYMAPEQALGEKVDRRADVFSVGMMLWDVLAGRRPFPGMPDIAILHKIMSGDIPSPRTAAPDIPASLEAICVKALAHSRDDRFATAAEMATALEEALDELGEKGSVRDAGKLIAAHFADERERMKKVIEAQVTAVQRASGSGPVALPLLAQERSEVTMREGKGASGGALPVLAVRDEGQASSITGAFAGRSVVPPAAGSSRSTGSVGVIVAGVVVAIVAVVAIVTFGGHGPDDGKANAGRETRREQRHAASAPSDTSRTITIDSMPQGATVTEGDQTLGTTPMTLKVDPSASTDRKLVMSLVGYTPHAFIPTAADVRIQVPLTPLPAPQQAASASVAPVKPVENVTRPHATPKADDIKMTR